MSIVLVGSTSGSITLQEPAVAGSTTINLPATSGTALVAPTALTVPNTTGTVMVSGNMPAFYARSNANQSLSGGVNTKVTLQDELFDTANCFDSTTNYRFTPNVAGYYQLNLCGNFGITARTVLYLYKNGSVFTTLWDVNTAVFTVSGSTIVYANGTTDYFEFYVYSGSSTTLSPGTNTTTFSGSLIRSA